VGTSRVHLIYKAPAYLSLLCPFASLEVNEMKWGKGKKGRDGVSTGGEWGEELSAQGGQGTMSGNSESEVAHGERGAHPSQHQIGSVRRV
jgi:hypothetical protein